MPDQIQPQGPTPNPGEPEDGPKLKSEDEMSKGKDYPITRDPPHFKFDPTTPTPQEGQGQGGYG